VRGERLWRGDARERDLFSGRDRFLDDVAVE